jgi:hypothetical protein
MLENKAKQMDDSYLQVCIYMQYNWMNYDKYLNYIVTARKIDFD